MSELPGGWTHFALKDLGGLSGGKTPSKANPEFWSSRDIPWVSPKDMKKSFLEDAEDRISQIAVDEAGMTLYPSGSVLMVTRSGILQHTFPVALTCVDLTVNQDIKVLRPVEGIVPKFSFYMLKSFGTEILTACSKDGTTVQSIESEKLEAFQFPLPPLAEQTRIAQKLDDLLAQVDTLKARIDGIPALLKRFRQSVLAAAVSGRLTEDWRVARMKSGEVDAPDAINFQKLSDICLSITDGDHQAPPQSDTGIPFITISAINDGVIRLEKATRYVPDSYYSELKESRKPQTGDILFSVTGSICIPAMVLNEAPFTFQRHIAILRPNTALALQKFMYFYLGSEQIKKQGLDVATGTAQLTVPLKGLRNFDISLPSLAEQTEIVRRVEQLFAFADQLAAKVASAKSRIDHLTQSILAKAFRGELVPQDPNDEPASVLLERIKTQRAAAPKAKRGRKSA